VRIWGEVERTIKTSDIWRSRGFIHREPNCQSEMQQPNERNMQDSQGQGNAPAQLTPEMLYFLNMYYAGLAGGLTGEMPVQFPVLGMAETLAPQLSYSIPFIPLQPPSSSSAAYGLQGAQVPRSSSSSSSGPSHAMKTPKHYNMVKARPETTEIGCQASFGDILLGILSGGTERTADSKKVLKKRPGRPKALPPSTRTVGIGVDQPEDSEQFDPDGFTFEEGVVMPWKPSKGSKRFNEESSMPLKRSKRKKRLMDLSDDEEDFYGEYEEEAFRPSVNDFVANEDKMSLREKKNDSGRYSPSEIEEEHRRLRLERLKAREKEIEEGLKSDDPKKRAKALRAQRGREDNSLTSKMRKTDPWKYFYNRFRDVLRMIRFEFTKLETYEAEGWRSANREKVRPTKELIQSRLNIVKFKNRVRELLFMLMDSEEARNEKRLASEDEEGISYELIECSKCSKSSLDDESNDIVMCDLEGCNKAFHQKCCIPPVSRMELEEDEDWFCRRCTCLLDSLDDINDHLGTDFDDWRKVFPPEELAAEREAILAELKEIEETQVSRLSGRKIKKPKTVVKAAWDTHSFHSDAEDDDDFGSDDGSSSDASSSKSSNEDEGSDEDEDLILDHKRERKKVDYKALNQELFSGKTDTLSPKDGDFVAGLSLEDSAENGNLSDLFSSY